MSKRVTIELEETDAKMLVEAARRFVDAASLYMDAKSEPTIRAWQRIQEAAGKAKKV